MAAKVKTQSVKTWIAKPKKRRPGVHAKTKTSRSKRSKNWLKLNRGQGH